MVIYIIFYFIIFVLSFKIQKKKWNFYDVLFLGIIILFSGLRYGIGSDYKLYESLYKVATNVNIALSSRTGIGYTYLTYLTNMKLGLTYPVLIFLISFLTNLLIYKFIKKNAERPGLTMLIFIALGFYSFTFNGFRQGLSTILVIYGFGCMKDKKKIKGLICYILGFLIHSISLLPIFVFTILELKPKANIKPRYVFLIILIGMIIYETLFVKIVGGLKGYSMYLVTETKYKSGIGTCINVLFYLCIYVLLILPNVKAIKEYNENNSLFLNISIIGIIINTFSLKNWLFNRVAYPFLIFVIFILADYYEVKEFRKKRLESLAFYTTIFIYYIVNTVSFNGIVPYDCILF